MAVTAATNMASITWRQGRWMYLETKVDFAAGMARRVASPALPLAVARET